MIKNENHDVFDFYHVEFHQKDKKFNDHKNIDNVKQRLRIVQLKLVENIQHH